MGTKIQWTEETWNAIGGCRRKSPGCLNCYAERQAYRLAHNPNEKIQAHYSGLTQITNGRPGWTGAVSLNETALLEPLRTKKPTTYFISLSDLFYDARPDEHIDRVFAVMALAPQHTFQLLTKYPERMLSYLTNDGTEDDESMRDRMDEAVINLGVGACHANMHPTKRWPLPNVWLGVSCENQQELNRRWPYLMRTPAAIRFLSLEPLLEELRLWKLTDLDFYKNSIGYETYPLSGMQAIPDHDWNTPKVDWVIVGGESGHKARPCNVKWIQSIMQQCADMNTPCFVKQLGAYPVIDDEATLEGWPEHVKRDVWKRAGGALMLNDPKGGDMEEWPLDLRVREYPRAKQ